MTESFEKEFKILREMGTEVFTLRGSNIIVEILPDEEVVSKGGIIIATPDNHAHKSVSAGRVKVGRVLMTGPGYWLEYDDKNGEYEQLEVKPGAIVLLPQHSYQTLSAFPGITRPTKDTLAMVKMDAITSYYPSQDAYETVKAKLNS